MKISGLFAFLFFCAATSAQTISLQKPLTSAADVDLQISSMARQVLNSYAEENPFDYFDNTVRLKMAAGLYQEALLSIDSLKQLIGISSDSSVAALMIHYTCFAKAKMIPPPSGVDFETHFLTVLTSVYQQLPEIAKPMTEQFFNQDTVNYVKELNRLIDENRGREQIELKSALQMVRNGFSLHVLRLLQKPAQEFFVKEEEKKYIIVDSLLLSKNGKASIPILVIRSKTLSAPVPAVVMNNIYAGPIDRIQAKEAADKGYAGVIINPRGKRNSLNLIEPFEHDGEDINTALDWISTQPWFNGKAGMYGGSYLGFSQWAAAKKIHPLLKTIVPQVSVGFGIDFPKFNGIYYGYMLRWLHYVTNTKLTDFQEFNNEERWKQLFVKWFTSGLPFRKLDSLEGRPMPLFQRWLDHPEFDAYWKACLPVDQDFRKINIPILTITGYFDDDQVGALHYYTQHLKWNAAAEHYLFMGPYDHVGAQGTPREVVLGYTIDSVARININTLVWEWFDYVLRGGSRPNALLGKITYQPMGTNQWKGAAELRSLSNDSLKLYLGHQYTSRGFLMQTVKPVKVKWLEQVTDFKERTILDFIAQAKSRTAPPVRDNIIFTSEPLQKELHMNGPLTGKVELSLNKKDADLLFELYELTADSTYYLLSATSQRLSYILNPEKRTLLTPGKTYQIPIHNSTFTSRQIAKGSRLVLYAGPLKDFNFEVNYGSGKPVSEESLADAAMPLKIHWGNSSYIKIPLLK